MVVELTIAYQRRGFASRSRILSRMGEVRVGVCSWADPALIEDGSFYPKKSMTAEARLRWYARFFDTVEINSSYYAIPAARNAVLWAERTPPGFVFNVKAYALMTGHHARPQTLPAELQLLRAVKRALDPKNLLNPGKVIDL